MWMEWTENENVRILGHTNRKRFQLHDELLWPEQSVECKPFAL